MSAKKSKRHQAEQESTQIAQNAYGPASVNLKIVERLLGVTVWQRSHEVHLKEGKPESLAAAQKVLDALSFLASSGHSPSEWDAECLVNLALKNPSLDLLNYLNSPLELALSNKKIWPKTIAQRHYLTTIKANDLVFGLGPAGTGKTYLAVVMAVAALGEGKVSRLILTRPAVEAGEKLGFLPGDLAEKVDPYLRPLYDALGDLLSYEKFVKLTERRIIEVAPLAFMRGRTLSDAFVILDEAQNCTREQMKMFLTRLGPGSKAVVTGDPGQSDLPGGQPQGLNEATKLLQNIEDIAFCHFTGGDVVRHRLVRKIIAAYESAGL